MDPITSLLLTSTLIALLGVLVLVFPLVFMFAGHLRPWFEQMAKDRAAGVATLPGNAGPPARRTAAIRKRKPAGKVAIAKTALSAPAAPKKKTATKKKAPAKKKAAAAKKKSAAPKKKAAKAKQKAATKRAPAGAKVDKTLGVIFTKKPKQVDNLKKITGVGKVLEGKLHQQGIYTFQQVADWSPAQMEAFGELLSFKNRIQRDGWKKQAKALHKAEHG